MTTILEDGSCIPSYLSTETTGISTPRSAFSNYSLKQGEVVDIIYPSDKKKSVSKQFVEYAVAVQERDGTGPVVGVLYPACTVINLFGGQADSLRYTYRKASKKPELKKGFSNGSKVLLLCVNGEARRAYIVGGLPIVPEAPEKESDGHNYFFEFNGAQATINKDGELQIRYRGATKVDGTLSDEANAEAEGSTIIFNKDGGIKLYTKDEAQYVFLDHANKKLEVLADEEWKVTVNKKLIFEVGDDINVTGQKACTIEIADNVNVLSSGVLVGDATDYWLLANKYRDAETKMLKEISSQMQSIMGLITAAAASLTTASAANAPPIVGGAAAAAPFAAAATALNNAAPKFAQISAAIDAFEARASSYLSKKNRND